MPKKPDFSTQTTVHWYYIQPRSTEPGAWVCHTIYSIEDALKLAEIQKKMADKEQRKLDKDTGIK